TSHTVLLPPCRAVRTPPPLLRRTYSSPFAAPYVLLPPPAGGGWEGGEAPAMRGPTTDTGYPLPPPRPSPASGGGDGLEAGQGAQIPASERYQPTRPSPHMKTIQPATARYGPNGIGVERSRPFAIS